MHKLAPEGRIMLKKKRKKEQNTIFTLCGLLCNFNFIALIYLLDRKTLVNNNGFVLNG